MGKTPNIVFFDIETTPVKTLRFQYDRSPYIKHDNILEDWYIICAAWRTLGSDITHAVAIKEVGNDYNVVKKLHEVLSKADVIVGHVIDRFDIRNLNSRLIYHNLPPLPNIPTIDTAKMSRKIGGFTSNKLDYLGQYFGLGRKIHVDGQLWRDVITGSKKALKQMVEYNKQDVNLNVDVYLRLRPYMKTHPHIGVIAGESKLHSCPNCGSIKLKRNGLRPTKAGIMKQEIQCTNCGSYHRIPVKN